MISIKDILFKNFPGCSSHNCYVRKPKGMGTNGPCSCVHDRSLQRILWARVSQIDSILEKK